MPRHLYSNLKRFPGGAAVLSPQLPRHLYDKLKRFPENGGLQLAMRSRAHSFLRFREQLPDYRFVVTLAHPSHCRAIPNVRELPKAFPRQPMFTVLKRRSEMLTQGISSLPCVRPATKFAKATVEQSNHACPRRFPTQYAKLTAAAMLGSRFP